VAVDGAGDLYIVDYGNNRVVEVTATGVASVLSTGSLTAPSGSSCTTTALCRPRSVAVDGAGDLFIVDGGNKRVSVSWTWSFYPPLADRWPEQ
jgi:sugar lactone lactonase YvrE